MSFDQCAAADIDTHRGSWKNAKHADQWKNTLATYASLITGALPVADVDTHVVVKVWAAGISRSTAFASRFAAVNRTLSDLDPRRLLRKISVQNEIVTYLRLASSRAPLLIKHATGKFFFENFPDEIS